eukprot:COSAG01_NODE_9763_length_2350_cov_69.696135_3_plen_142_part_01
MISPEALVLANLSTMQKLKNLRHASSGVHRGTMAPTMGAVVPQDMHMPKIRGLSTAALHKGGCSYINCYRYVTTCYFRQSAKHQHFCTSILQKNKPALLLAAAAAMRDADRARRGPSPAEVAAKQAAARRRRRRRGAARAAA